MRLALYLGLGVLCGLASAAPLMAQPTAKPGIYTCVDAAGQRFTVDRPIVQCADREQRVLGPSGVERTRIGPVLTELEMAQHQELLRREQLQQQRAQEQRRRDAVLLARFPERSLHEAARQDALLQVEEMQALAYQRLRDLDREKKQLDQELQAFKQDPAKAPARLRAYGQDLDKAKQDQRALLAAQAAEAQRIHQRFDADLQRLQPLWQSQKPGLPAATTPLR